MVSVIIPSYNRANLISQTIKSVISQSYKDWELIIVDDGSTDNSDEIIQPFLIDLRIKYLKRPLNRLSGGNAARNYGFEKAKGIYVKWLDSDDLLKPNALEKQLKIINSNNKTEVVFSRSQYFKFDKVSGEMIFENYWSKNFPETKPFENYLFGKIRFSTADALWKKSFFNSSPFKENIKNSQEWLMYIENLSKVQNYQVDSEVLVYSRQHEGQMHNQKKKSVHYKNQVLARFYAIRYLIEKNKLKFAGFSYLYKSMIWFFIKSLRNFSFSLIPWGVYTIARTAVMFIFYRTTKN